MLGSDFSYRSREIKDQRVSVVRSIEHEVNLLFSFQKKVRTFRPHINSPKTGKEVLARGCQEYAEGWETWRSLNTSPFQFSLDPYTHKNPNKPTKHMKIGIQLTM